jgi:type II secretion system protein H
MHTYPIEQKEFSGNPPRRPGRKCALGFTLIELILVMAMLSIVISVALPSLKGFFRGRNLDSEARRFLSLTHYGQSRAVSEGLPMVLWIDARQNTYGLQTQAGYMDADTNAVEFTVDKDLQIEALTPQVVSLTQSNLWTQSAPAVGATPMIRFQPDGFIGETSPEQIVFRQGANDAIWIAQSTNRLTYEIQPRNSSSARR